MVTKSKWLCTLKRIRKEDSEILLLSSLFLKFLRNQTYSLSHKLHCNSRNIVFIYCGLALIFSLVGPYRDSPFLISTYGGPYFLLHLSRTSPLSSIIFRYFLFISLRARMYMKRQGSR